MELTEMSQLEMDKCLEEALLCLQPERPQSIAGAAKLRAHNLLMKSKQLKLE